MLKKRDSSKYIDTIDECITDGINNGIFQVSLEDNSLNGRTVTISGSEVVNFGSCSYLGLETDDRLKQGAIDAALRYGRKGATLLNKPFLVPSMVLVAQPKPKLF